MSKSSFETNIRSAFRGLWSGVFDRYDFDSAMVATINQGFNDAWAQGMKAAGLSIADMSAEERSTLEDLKRGQYAYIQTVAQALIDGSKANGGLWGAFSQRINLWAIRWDSVYHTALTMAQNDPPLEWKINVVRIVKQNCKSCLALNGKVKRASFWRDRGIQPQSAPNPHLNCGGWECGCGLVPTDKSISKGRLPKLP